MSQRPVVVGLNVCKDVIVDRTTGHVTLVNRVQRVRSASFPTRPEDYKVCCFVADGHGETAFSLEVSELSTGESLYFRHWRISVPKTLSEQWLLVTVKDIVFPRPGRYEFLLQAQGEWFASSAITILGRGE